MLGFESDSLEVGGNHPSKVRVSSSNNESSLKGEANQPLSTTASTLSAEAKILPLVLVGLGNPGRRYELTRHNLGAMVVAKFAGLLNWPFGEDVYLNGLVAKGEREGRRVYCLLPQTYMNESGWSVRRCIEHWALTPAEIIVVSDDVALDYGQLRLRLRGTSGGHNGLKSIEAYLGTNRFTRLRMGVGSKGVEQSLAEYVLSDFNAEEAAVLDEFIMKGVEVLKGQLSKLTL